MQVSPPERPAFVRVLPPELILDLPPTMPARPLRVAFVRTPPPEFGCRFLPAPNRGANNATTAARPAARARCSLAAHCLASSHTRCSNRPGHGADGCGAASWEAAENRTVPVGARRFVFVTGAPVNVVARHEAAGSGLERPLWDAKRVAAT